MRYFYRPEHPAADQFGYVPEHLVDTTPVAFAEDAPLHTDKGYENVVLPDGTQLTSRSKYNAYLKRHGLTHRRDFTNEWAQAAKHRADAHTPEVGVDHKQRREDIGRAAYEYHQRRRNAR